MEPPGTWTSLYPVGSQRCPHHLNKFPGIPPGDFVYKPPATPNLANVKRLGIVVLAWGRGDDGQLAIPTDGPVFTPTRVEALAGKDIIHVASNIFNSAFVTEDGELYTVGNNDYGQLGTKRHESQFVPVRVNALDLYKIQHAAYGQNHALAVTDQGTVASWGAAEFGQLGQGIEAVDQPQPRIIKGLRDARRVVAGAAHSVVLTGGGHVYSFGQGTFGQLGLGDEENKDMPVLVERLWPFGIVQVVSGDNHCVALSVDGRVFTWGRGKYGQLGLGDFKSVNTPTHVKALQGVLISQVACGGDHTLVLTMDGAVHSWGRGTWGQLGLGSIDNTCRPNRVQALDGLPIVQVAAGFRHSVALSRDNSMFVWGDGEQGQLGLGGNGQWTMQLSPRRLDGLPNLPVLYLAAAGDHSMAVLKDVQPGEQVAIGPSHMRPYGAAAVPIAMPHLHELCEQAARDQENVKAVNDLVAAIDNIFTSPGFLVAGFALPPSPENANGVIYSPKAGNLHLASSMPSTPSSRTSSPLKPLSPSTPSPSKAPSGTPAPPHFSHHNMDIDAINASYQAILKVYKTEVVAALGSSCLRLLDQLLACLANKHHACSVPDTDWLPVLLVLLQNPLNGESSGTGSALVSKLVSAVLQLGEAAQQMLAHWLAGLPLEVFGGRVLRPMQRYVTRLASTNFGRARADILRAAQVLSLLYDANEANGTRIPLSEFYNKAVSEHANLKVEYIAFATLRSQQQQQQPRAMLQPLQSICQAPFLLTPDAKNRILQGEATVQKQHMVHSSAMSAMFQGIQPGMVAYLDIHVRRSHILHDSLEQILSQPQDLKKPLRVTFILNGVPEDGLDEGGVSREFFQLLVAEIFNADYGMFLYSEETRTFWFNPTSLESSIEFQLVGIVLGLAIYNGVILDVHFPLVVYKKLLGMRPTFADLAEVQPSLHRGLQQLLDFEGDVENTFCRTFEIEYDFFGETRRHELFPGGASTPVTATNRRRYVELYAQWLLEGSIEKQFNAFAYGFHQVCGGIALSLFRHDELELLICGLPHLDFHELEKGARYEGGYHAAHPAVRMFWSIVHDMTLDQKKRFLFFCTGCDRAPVGGLSQLVMTIQRSGPDTDRLPTSHTCFNILLLPDYSSRQKMKERLLLAIENAQGFGLQ